MRSCIPCHENRRETQSTVFSCLIDTGAPCHESKQSLLCRPETQRFDSFVLRATDSALTRVVQGVKKDDLRFSLFSMLQGCQKRLSLSWLVGD